MGNKSIEVDKLELLSLVNRLNESQNKKSCSKEECAKVNKIWMDCLEKESSLGIYSHKFEVSEDLYQNYLRKYLS